MKPLHFRYKSHPGDLLRNTDIVPLPDPKENLEDFLVWFLTHYQSDDRIAYLDDLYKLLHNEFSNEEDRLKFVDQRDDTIEIQDEIDLIEKDLEAEAYENFYHLLRTDRIEIVAHS